MAKKNWARKQSKRPAADKVEIKQKKEKDVEQTSSAISSYLVSLASEMEENERRMSDILDQSLLMISNIDWKEIRKNARAKNGSHETFRNMVRNMLDVFSGIIMNCSTFGTACNLAIDLISADIDRSEEAVLASTLLQDEAHDRSSLEWILKAANAPIETNEQHKDLLKFRSDLERHANGFADISTRTVVAMKETVILCTGF